MKSVGYNFLISNFGLRVCETRMHSYLWESSKKKESIIDSRQECHYPLKFWNSRGDDWTNHLEFAFKYEGINLEVLVALFKELSLEDVAKTVKSKPLGGFSRRLWFCYEFLTGMQLPIEDLKTGNYISLLNEELQFALPQSSSVREGRYRIVNNLLGDRRFCPTVYRTEKLSWNFDDAVKSEAAAILDSYSAEIIYRAVQYLFIKETRSSFAIEHETADNRRTGKFMDILRGMNVAGEFTFETVVSWQNEIVDDRYAASTWRKDQVYVGETLSPSREFIHYIAPKPEDVPGIMDGWFKCADKLLGSDDNVLMTTALLSFAFVFIHPFDDGNGRIHRLLMHYFLARKGFVPKGLIFPVSAFLLKNPNRYDAILETFSRRVMQVVEYDVNEIGEVSVSNDTIEHYRFIDFTVIVEKFIDVMRETMEKEWKAELAYLQGYDAARNAMRLIVDMPEKKANQFIRFLMQNAGKLSKGKRHFFPELSDSEISALESAVKQGMDRSEAVQ